MCRFTHMTAQQSLAFRASLPDRVDGAYHWTSRHGASACRNYEYNVRNTKKYKRLSSLCLNVITVSDVDHVGTGHAGRELDHLGAIVERRDLQRDLLARRARRRHVQVGRAGVGFHHCNHPTDCANDNPRFLHLLSSNE